MNVEYRSSFIKDIKKLKSAHVSTIVRSVIENCETAQTISDIKHCEPLQSRGKFFKIIPIGEV
jgi:mRNA-degrading endonuclease RelE of RelBE toxin-antitoxin system